MPRGSLEKKTDQLEDSKTRGTEEENVITTKRPGSFCFFPAFLPSFHRAFEPSWWIC
jgi:hypothetical protein